MANEPQPNIGRPNVFTFLDNFGDKSIDAAAMEQFPLFLKRNVITRYPLSLGKINGGIPFTLFMPYKRDPFNKDDKFALSRAIQKENLLYERLPTPDFAIALPTPTSALKTTYQSNYDDVNLGQTAGLVAESFQKQGLNKQSANHTNNGPATSGAGAFFDNKGGGGAAAPKSAPTAVEESDGTPTFVTAFKDAFSAARGAGQGLASQASLALDMTALGLVGAAEGAANVIAGVSENPFTDRLFKNVEFRQHVFNYTFLPKSQQDSEHIDKIIQLFKYAMLPRPASTAGFFEFPYEFQIVHSIQATTFTLLPSVLDTMETDFGGGTDSLKLFKTTSGGKQYPTKITVNLSFKEMVLLNRDRITSFRGENYFSSDNGVENKPGGAPSDTDVKRYRF